MCLAVLYFYFHCQKLERLFLQNSSNIPTHCFPVDVHNVEGQT